MSLPCSIAGLFLKDSQLVSESETFTLGQWKYTGAIFVVPPITSAQSLISSICFRDTITITLNFGAEPLSISSKRIELLKEFLNQIGINQQAGEEGEIISVEIIINKSLQKNTTSLYSLQAFIQTLEIKSLGELYGVFAPVTESEHCITIEVFEPCEEFYSSTIIFCNRHENENKFVGRSELLQKRSDYSHFESCASRAIPADFYLVRRSEKSNLNKLFDKLCIVTCITFLADITKVCEGASGNRLWYKFNGYKSISGEIDFTSMDHDTVVEFFNIYDWVYSSGGNADKIGLARNIISLHWNIEHASFTDRGTYNSIRSGYEIYLKRNVQQYIEIKNRLSDFLCNFSQKATKLADTMCDKLERNFVAFGGFFISSVIVKVVSDRSFSGVFTPALAKIGYTIISLSTIHLIATVTLFNKDKMRLIDDYNIFKSAYTDLLDPKDLEAIFVKSGGIHKTIEYLKFKRNLFVKVWGISIGVFIILVSMFTDWKYIANSQTTNSKSQNTFSNLANVGTNSQNYSGSSKPNTNTQIPIKPLVSNPMSHSVAITAKKQSSSTPAAPTNSPVNNFKHIP